MMMHERLISDFFKVLDASISEAKKSVAIAKKQLTPEQYAEMEKVNKSLEESLEKVKKAKQDLHDFNI